MAVRATKTATSIKTSTSAIKASAGRAFWVVVSTTTAGVAGLTDGVGGTTMWADSLPVNSVVFVRFDPPLEFPTGIAFAVSGWAGTGTTGYE